MAITQHIEFRTEKGHQYFRELENLTKKQLCEVWDKTMNQIKEKYSEENDGKCESNINR